LIRRELPMIQVLGEGLSCAAPCYNGGRLQNASSRCYYVRDGSPGQSCLGIATVIFGAQP
jgi:hypothetical protein